MQNTADFSENPNLFPIQLHEGVHVVDSRLIAEALGIEHGNFMETIRKYQNDTEIKFGIIPFQTVISGKVGKPQKYALLNESQATFLATLSRNTPEVIEFKAKLVLSFAELRKDFSKVYQLWHEITEMMRADDEMYNNNITLIEKTCEFIYDTCLQLRADVTALQKQVFELQRERNETKQFLFTLSQQMQEQQKQMQEQQKQIAYLQSNQTDNKGTLDTTVKRVDKIEETLEFKAVACVYVMYSGRKQWHKLGSSHDAKGRRVDFATVEPHLKILIEIPTASREEAYVLENALKKRFASRHKEGEWYALLPEDLAYLQELAQSNRIHLLRTTNS